MCRWLAYSGSPVLIEELLYRPEHSLIDQTLHSRLGVDTTNGDGFGLGWYSPHTQTPAVFHSIEPAWNDRNLREVASHVESPLFLAHIRASTGTAVQQTNCHPFRHGRWLWVHNGLVRDFHRIKRDLALAVDESLYPQMEGSTDSEMLFYLALTFGLEDDPPAAVERMVGLVEEVGRRHGTEHPIQMTIGTTDGKACGRSGTPARASRARCTTPQTCARYGSYTLSVRACRSSPTRRGSSSRSRWWTCPGRGTKYRNLATASYEKEMTRCTRSHQYILGTVARGIRTSEPDRL